MPADKMFNITIPGPGPWGFRLAGGRDFNTPLYISKVTPGGKAANCSILPNDCVLSINGMETEKLTHLDAQSHIKGATGNLNLKLQRGEATLWKPKINRDETDAAVTSVSLHANKQTFNHPGSGHNAVAKPFAASPGPGAGMGRATVVHKQFNSPVGIYSSENIADSFKGQTEGMIAGRVGGDMPASTPVYGHAAKPYTPTYQEPPSYSHGQAPAQYIDRGDDEEMRYGGYINPGSQSRSFKMLQSMTAEEEAAMDAPPQGVRSVKAPTASPHAVSRPAPTLPMCFRCNLGIVGPVLKAKDKTLHPECFICYMCDAPLKNKGFFTVQGKEYCHNCERQARMDASAGSNPSYTNGSSSQPTTAQHHSAPPAAKPYSAPPPPATQHYKPSQPPAHQHYSAPQDKRPRHPRPPPLVSPPVVRPPSRMFNFKSRYSAPQREDPNAIIARALMQNPDAVKTCQGVVPVFTVDNTVKHEMPTGPQSPTSPGMNFPREPGAPDDGVKVMFLPSSAGKQTPSQIATQARSNPVPRAMSQPPPRAPGPPPPPPTFTRAPQQHSRAPMANQPRQQQRAPQQRAQQQHAPQQRAQQQQHAQTPAAGGGPSAGRTPMCDGCDSIIRGAFVSAVGRNWHPEHFVCVHCHENLSNQGFMEQNGKVYCEKDFNSLYAPKCAICHRSISQGGCVQAMGSTYHQDCFLCHHCNEPITGTAFHISEGKPYCKKDYQALFSVRCAGCNYPVEPGDAWVEALKKQWHSTCFNCSNPSCGTPLEGQAFYADRGQPYCKHHAP
ncbi:PDZ and LIM domain protein 5-like isoform X1 [Asterias amurensis]|uniref:PDZ and LIM domain protein 5-like isoform X1 n=1 Tax=Asterias amurensis TaxID=7602 RepID=UPI003AB3AB7F